MQQTEVRSRKQLNVGDFSHHIHHAKSHGDENSKFDHEVCLSLVISTYIRITRMKHCNVLVSLGPPEQSVCALDLYNL
jgi:hypothetical protein